MVSLLTVLFCFCSIAVCGKGMGLTVDPEGQDVLAVDLLSEPSEPTESKNYVIDIRILILIKFYICVTSYYIFLSLFQFLLIQ